jgi:hypothetical protein
MGCCRRVQAAVEKKKNRRKIKGSREEREVAALGERREKSCVFSQPLPSEIRVSFVV